MEMATPTEHGTINSKNALCSENDGITGGSSPTNKTHDLLVKPKLEIDILTTALDPDPNDP
jgi:hypothetical protein